MDSPKFYHIPIEVRFADLDAYGHVNNATYFTYLETARTRILHNVFNDFIKQSLLFLVVKAECEYKHPISLEDTVVVSLAVTRIGQSSFDIEYEIHNDSGTVFALAKTVMVCFDDKKKETTQVPQEFKEAIMHE